MPRKFLKRFFPAPEQIRSHESLRFLGALLHDANLWHLNRRSVAGAFAVGLFVCFIPVPMQMALAAIVAVIFRVNLPISVSLVWVTNPLTMPVLFYFAYVAGVLVLGVELEPFAFEFSADWLFLELGTRWRPFLLGCLIMASLSSLLGFVLVRLLWRLHLVKRIKERKLLRTLRLNGLLSHKKNRDTGEQDEPE
jgi:uncharacterized protein (DUF2062 family)